ncbi:hypothetical protein MRB53_006934 [Persea americana]|uniref:Uncharacterized protein n=1 Tax=Persea americana TaxID=3435 RepID=A0ACC2MIH6_PERAE|nr:hypothetical protein MRB53_006934 [Persea americana]
MAIGVAAIVVPLGLLFILSGLMVNLIQAICFILVRPLSKSMYRRVNRVVVELLWLELIWLIDWWGGVKDFWWQVDVYADSETFQSLGKEHALVVSNHRSDIDWLVGWVLAQRSGCLGSTLAVMKKSSKFLPVIGWSMWFSEYVFLERSWAKDESTLKSGLQRLKDFPRPFWLALFVEGTRFTQAKLLAAQEYAASTGLPIPRNVLIPRTKGFVSAVSNMRSFVPAIYDVTVAIPKTQPSPTMLRIFKRQPSVDALLDRHLAEGKFDEKEFKPIRLPIKSLLVISSWSLLLMFGVFKFLKWSALLSTWKGAAVSTAVLLLVTVVMYMFILYSQAERSSPRKVAPSGPENGAAPLQAKHD